MAEKTGIAWCDSTFNPWLGCTKVSPACDNCYAERFGKRLGVEWGPNAERRRTSVANWRQPLRWNRNAGVNEISAKHILRDDKAGEKSHAWARAYRRPRVFCGSLCDVFDNAVPGEWRRDLLKLIRATPNLDWLVLTKRIGNALNMLDADVPERFDPEDHPCAWPHLWLGATICNQEEADRDIPKLLATPAAKRFLSIEPMLGPIDLTRIVYPEFKRRDEHDPYIAYDTLRGHMIGPDDVGLPKLDWVICGNKNNHHARPLHPEWVRSLRDQCQAAGTAFFFKQWGAWCQGDHIDQDALSNGMCAWVRPDGGFASSKDGTFVNRSALMYRAGKKDATRLLDGREWNEVPA